MAFVLEQTNGDAVGCPTIEIADVIAEARDVIVVAVTTDQELRAALSELLAKNGLLLTDSAEQALAGPAPSNCAVLIVEQTLSRSSFDQLKAHFKASAPALVSIMVGTGDSGSSLVARLSQGHIDRFMVKPFKVGPTRSALRSALQQYRSLCQCMRAEEVAKPIPVEATHGVAPKKQAASSQQNAARAAQAPAQRNEVRTPAPVLKQLAIAGPQKSAKARYAEVANDEFIEPPSRTSKIKSTPRMDATRKSTLPAWAIPFAALAATFALVIIGLATRTPDLDKHKIIAGHLAAANRAVAIGSYVDPPELSAVHFYTAVLELDAANLDAKRGLEAIADRMIADSKDRIAAGDLLRAQSIIDSVRRIEPNHRELADVTASLFSAREFERVTLDAARAAPVGTAEPLVVVSAQAALAAPRAGASAPKAANRTAVRPQTSTVSTSKSVAPLSDGTPEKNRSTNPAEPGADDSLTVKQASLNSNGRTELGGSPVDVARNESVLLSSATAAAIQEKTPAEADPLAIATDKSEIQTAALETKLVKYVAPVYPQKARADRVEAWVDVHFVVASDGSVVKPRVENGSRDAAFRSAALTAVSQWRYSPAPTGASPHRPMIVKVKFQLADGKRT